MKTRYKILMAVEVIALAILVVVSITTIVTSLRLVSLSNQHYQADLWRINPMGSAAANNVQELVNEKRQAIYNSGNWVVRYIANLPDVKQEFMVAIFMASPVLAFLLFRKINLNISKKLRRRRRARMH